MTLTSIRSSRDFADMERRELPGHEEFTGRSRQSGAVGFASRGEDYSRTTLRRYIVGFPEYQTGRIESILASELERARLVEPAPDFRIYREMRPDAFIDSVWWEQVDGIPAARRFFEWEGLRRVIAVALNHERDFDGSCLTVQ